MSMQSLGRAILTLGTDDRGYNKGMKTAHDKAVALQQTFIKVGGALTAVGAGFAVAAKSAIDLGDKYEKTSQKVGVSVESLSALKMAAELSGSSFDELSKGLAKLAQNAKDTADGTGEAKDAFEALGIKVKDQEGNLLPVEDLLFAISDKLGAMKDGTEKTALAMDLFGRAGVNLIPLLNQQASGLQGMKDQAAELGLVMSTDTAKGAAAVNDSLTRLSGAFSGFVNTMISSGILDMFANFVNKAAAMVSQFNAAHPVLTQVIGVLGLLAAAVGPVLIALGLMLPAIVSVVGVLSGPVGIIVAIGVAVTALGTFLATNDTVRETVVKIWDAIKEKFEKVFDAIGKVIEKVTKHYQKIWEDWGDEITALFKGIWGTVKAVTEAAFKLIGGVLSGAVDVLTGIVQVFAGALTGDWEMFGEGLKSIWRGVWEGIKSIIMAPIDAIKGTVSSFAGSVTGVFQGMYDKLVGHSIVPDLMTAIGGQFRRLLTEVAPTAGAGVDGIVAEFDRLNSEGVPAFSGALTSMSGEFSSFTGTVTDPESGIGTIGSAFGGLLNSLQTKIGPDLGGLLDGLLGKFKGLFSPDILGGFGKIGSAFSGLLNTITDTAGKIGGAVAGIASGIANIFSGGLTGFIGGAVGGFFGGLLGGGGGKDRAIEENTRYCRIALVGPLGVIDILHSLEGILWKVRDSLYENAGSTQSVLWTIHKTLSKFSSAFSTYAESATATAAAAASSSKYSAGISSQVSGNFTIQSIDSSDMERAVRTRIMPMISRTLQNTRGRL